MMVTVFISTLLLLLSPTVALFINSSAQDGRAKTGGQRSTWVWSHTDDGVVEEVKVEGGVVFTDDYTDIRSVSEDGQFLARDERGGVARKLRVVRGADGTLQRSYSLNGRAHEFDAEAKAWLSKFLLEAVRGSGLDAKARVQRLLRERGGRGVLDEISLLKSDYARRIYFETLIKDGALDGPTLESALRQAARQISSDYELAVFLIESVDSYLDKDKLIPVFFEATRRIGSDYEHRRVLSAVVERHPRRPVLSPMLESAASISSDYEKASFLIEAATLYLGDASLRSAFLQAVNSISSDYERGRVLSVVAKKTQLGSTSD
ncbi:MAG TPA: hypothetical protein VF553_19015 [Pyrinomonadaceae bacterium]